MKTRTKPGGGAASPMLALPPGSGKAVAAALRVKRCLAFGLAVEATADDDAARRTALEDLAALAFAQRSEVCRDPRCKRWKGC